MANPIGGIEQIFLSEKTYQREAGFTTILFETSEDNPISISFRSMCDRGELKAGKQRENLRLYLSLMMLTTSIENKIKDAIQHFLLQNDIPADKTHQKEFFLKYYRRLEKIAESIMKLIEFYEPESKKVMTSVLNSGIRYAHHFKDIELHEPKDWETMLSDFEALHHAQKACADAEGGNIMKLLEELTENEIHWLKLHDILTAVNNAAKQLLYQNAELLEFKGHIKYQNGFPKLLLPDDDLIEKLGLSTGFEPSDRAFREIVNEIQELPNVDSTERDNFFRLLCGTLNYQGYCFQRGIYKGVNNLSENDFRDSVIQHFTGLQYLGGKVIMEGHVGGGRVEISFHGIIAELKVERNISERDKLFEKYGKQPVVYASGNSTHLSILCILDLTDKILPSGVPANSIKLLTPPLHGFEKNPPPNPSKLLVVIIDGNTKNPSDYNH